MLSVAVLTACIASMPGLVSSTPAPRQATQCNPNFEGAGVSIIDNDIEWGVSPAVAGTVLNRDLGGFPLNATAEWHVEQTGAYPPTYIVKLISNNELVVGIGVNQVLTLQEIDSSIPPQIWEIYCNSCSSGASSTPGGGEFASGCKIISAASGLCAGAEPAGVTIGTFDCAPVVSQNWDFWTATA
ncbi:hypothetical protein K438DRAFT_1746814 [Mycena galopus ATCC 62051]|nr:hypothetical protein K438DRAFT_1746814 [Mycena galopus ATCC 62051]